MTPTVRWYDSEERAREAARALENDGFRADSICVLAPAPGNEEAAVDGAIRDDAFPGSYRTAGIRALREGRFVVSVDAPFGHGVVARRILDECGPVDPGSVTAYSAGNPAPFSETLGLPVLSEARSMTELPQRNSYTFGSFLGIGLRSDKAAPLSSMFGMPTASRGPGERSFGMSLLSSNPAPLSSMFALKTLSAPKQDWVSSFGFPLLSRNPTPLSSLFGIPTLLKR